jgi:hypothetical protein
MSCVRYCLHNSSPFAAPDDSRRPYGTLYLSQSAGPGKALYWTTKSTGPLSFLDQMRINAASGLRNMHVCKVVPQAWGQLRSGDKMQQDACQL